MERKIYFLGLFETVKLIIEDNDDFEYEDKVANYKLVVKDKAMKVYRKGTNLDDYKEVNDILIDQYVIKQLSVDGSRWEGGWYEDKPFGFGSYYDDEGNRIYTGFMLEGKKIGFGTEYFADVYKVDYCGTFMNDQRNGWGISYDRNGKCRYHRYGI